MPGLADTHWKTSPFWKRKGEGERGGLGKGGRGNCGQDVKLIN